jgi:carbonic anhydrase/acetyltransferase-like protein (isoleucine patch superfamily)
MIIEHAGQRRDIHPDAWVAPDATVCGNVFISAGTRIMHGARLIAESGSITIGRRTPCSVRLAATGVPSGTTF